MEKWLDADNQNIHQADGASAEPLAPVSVFGHGQTGAAAVSFSPCAPCLSEGLPGYGPFPWWWDCLRLSGAWCPQSPCLPGCSSLLVTSLLEIEGQEMWALHAVTLYRVLKERTVASGRSALLVKETPVARGVQNSYIWINHKSSFWALDPVFNQS